MKISSKLLAIALSATLVNAGADSVRVYERSNKSFTGRQVTDTIKLYEADGEIGYRYFTS